MRNKRWLLLLLGGILAASCTACGADMQQESTQLDAEEETIEVSTLSSEELSSLADKLSTVPTMNFQEKDTASGASASETTTTMTTGTDAEIKNFIPAVWVARTNAGDERYFFFEDNTNGHYLEQETGQGMGFTYEMRADETAVFHFGDTASEDIAYVTWLANDSCILSWEEDEIETLSILRGDAKEEFLFYSNQQLCEMSLNYYQAKTGYRPAMAYALVNADEDILIQLYDELDDHTTTADWYTIDRYSAVGKDMLGETIDLKQTPQAAPAQTNADTNPVEAAATAEIPSEGETIPAESLASEETASVAESSTTESVAPDAATATTAIALQ